MAKVFSLEALPARHGDALILHFGAPAAPKTIVLDGGPPGVWRSSLRPRLEALRQERGDGGALLVELLVISDGGAHHLAGAVALLEELADKWEADEEAPWVIERLWHHASDDAQGRRLRVLARKLQLEVARPRLSLHGFELSVL